MKTNLEMVKRQSKLLFDMVSFEDARSIIDDELSGLIISHPFTNSAFVLDKETKQIVNLYDDDKNQEKYRNTMFEMIDSADSLTRMAMFINTPYLLYWFHLIHKYLGEKDYAEMLKHVWVESENPNMDVNVPVMESLGFFEEADLRYLMDKEEKAIYDKIPNEVTLYRGVSKGRNSYGLSYTLDKEKAKWFMNRFYKNEGHLITLNVKKEDCICYLNVRDEKEVVLNINHYLKEIGAQIPKENSYEEE